MKKYILALLVISLPLQTVQAASHRPAALRMAAASFVAAVAMISAAQKVMRTRYNRVFGHPLVSVGNISGFVGMAAWVTTLACLGSCALPARVFGYK